MSSDYYDPYLDDPDHYREPDPEDYAERHAIEAHEDLVHAGRECDCLSLEAECERRCAEVHGGKDCDCEAPF